MTNPHEFTVDGVHMLGTSGQNVDDVAKYSTEDDRLQILDSCLAWAHLAPTGPDTLTVYPFKSSDPFVMNQAPHVMFVGNQPKFQTGWYGGGSFKRSDLPALCQSARTSLLQYLCVVPIKHRRRKCTKYSMHCFCCNCTVWCAKGWSHFAQADQHTLQCASS